MTQIQIECFLAAVRTGSFTGASREIFLSVQAVSQHILNLEKELGSPLFIRSSEGVELNREGTEFLSFATRLAGLFETTVHAVREQYRSLSQQLTIGLSDYIDGLGAISGGILSFAEKHPTADIAGVQYSNREVIEAVMDGSVDVALMSDSQIFIGGDFDVFPFAKEELRLYISHLPELTADSTLKEACEMSRSLPHLDASYGPWSNEEWDEISRRMSARLGISFPRHVTMPNFRSVITSVKYTACTAVCDARFGYLRDGDGLRSFSLNADACLCIVSDKKNENPLIADFQEHMKHYYE